MGHIDDRALNSLTMPLAEEDPFVALQSSPAKLRQEPVATPSQYAQPMVAEFAGFDLQDQPLVKLQTRVAMEVVPARTTVALRSEQIGQQALVVCEDGDVYKPIVIGLLQSPHRTAEDIPQRARLTIQADDERYVITAEREIVLKCGEASITLTRAGKVLIKGNYILSRSAGHNRIKGAAVDIN